MGKQTKELLAYFRDKRNLLQEKLAAGELRYLVEWWEQDEHWVRRADLPAINDLPEQ